MNQADITLSNIDHLEQLELQQNIRAAMAKKGGVYSGK